MLDDSMKLLIEIILRLVPIVCILFSIVFVPVQCEKVEVDDLNMFNGRPFFVRCTLQLDVANDERIRDKPFVMQHSQRGSCEVRNFMVEGACSPEPEKSEANSCACSNNWNSMGVQFRFYFYIGNVNSTIDEGNGFKCSIEVPADGNDKMELFHSGFIKVFKKYDDKEKPVTYECPGEETKFNFKFNARGMNQKARHGFDHVKVMRSNGDTIVTFVNDPILGKHKAKWDKSTRFFNRIEFKKSSDQVMSITIKKLQESDSEQFRILFYYKRHVQEVPPPKIPLLNNSYKVEVENITDEEIPLLNGTHKEEVENITDKGVAPTQVILQGADSAVGGTRRAKYVAPAPVIEKQVEMFFSFDKELIITQPPVFAKRTNTLIHFWYSRVAAIKVGTESANGGVLFRCNTTEKMEKPGMPPVHISLYHGYDQLKSQVASSRLDFKLQDPDVNKRSKCILTGPSLNCLPEGDFRKKGMSLQLTKETKSRVAVSFNIILYTLAILINMVLLWWTIWLVTHHVNLIVKRRKKLAIYRAKILLKHRAVELDEYT